jgi:hypothetical protein
MKFRKKPVVIEATQWFKDGDHPAVKVWNKDGHVYPNGTPLIDTLEGELRVSPGDWIITGVKGEHYPCKPDIFEATYETAGGDAPPKARIVGGVAMADQFDFGLAIHALKNGERVARRGWNGKGMWLAYTPGSEVLREHVKPGHALSKIAAEFPEAPSLAIGGHIDMRAADGTLVVGWLASQTDMLAEDWLIVE